METKRGKCVSGKKQGKNQFFFNKTRNKWPESSFKALNFYFCKLILNYNQITKRSAGPTGAQGDIHFFAWQTQQTSVTVLS
ncbi:hypothetical protein B0I18_11555 [Taibaiella chishuiensis]|uniref:Uncharacterized protein n=1 Tax=Taibaiella chishuiensis TaxID=1434707 RepID=A0A2P8CT65_9BACT|nr:hypothetical protein B0I18_11555 [Taibaiella chishuiensis]